MTGARPFAAIWWHLAGIEQRSVGALRHEQAFTDKVTPGHFGLSGKEVIRREQGRHTFLPDRLVLAGSHVTDAAHESDVEIALPDGVRQPAARAFLQDEVDLRVAIFEAFEAANHELPAEWRGKADVELLSVLAARRGAAQGLLETIIVIASALDPVPAFICPPDTVFVALEDLDIELLFEGADIAADGGFADTQGARHAAHAAQLCRRENIFEVAQRFVHRGRYRSNSTTRACALENPLSETEKTISWPPSAVAFTLRTLPALSEVTVLASKATSTRHPTGRQVRKGCTAPTAPSSS